MRMIGGRYTLCAEVAAGGMATVHLARQSGAAGFSRIVAVKRMHERFSKDPEFVGMFLDEARLVARIRHPNVVTTLDVVAEDNEVFIVMEYIHGDSIYRAWQLLKREQKTIPIPIANAVLAGALHGLHAAHEAKSEAGAPLGIVHRDISPQNILVGVDGIARVLDFGVAKASERVQTTRDGQLKGKLSYMPPEQIRDEELDRRADVYAAAVVLWEGLAGAKLFTGSNEGALVQQLLHDPVKPPSTHNRAIPPELDAIVMRGLSRDRHERFSTAAEMANALEKTGPLATPSEVGAWLGSVCAAGLTQRRELIAQIELGSSSLRDAQSSLKSITSMPPAPKPSAPEITPSGTPNPIAYTDPPVAPQPSLAPPTHANIGQPRNTAILAAVATVVGVLGVFGGILIYMSVTRKEKPPAVATPPLPTTPPSAAAKLSCPDGMIAITGGSFFMGSDDERPEEKPAHKVTLGNYCIDKYEVTAEAYRACSDRGECKRAGTTNRWPGITPQEAKVYDRLCTSADPQLGKHPINCVDWSMAERFCKSASKRLPTEAEWEYAARGSDGRKYPWGDDPPSEKRLNACGKECLAWGKKNAAPQSAMYPGDDGWPTTAPVGSFPSGASRWGVEDVVGNVWEWTADVFAPYTAGDLIDPTGPSDGESRVIRGGAWNGAMADWVRPSFRFHSAPDLRSHGIGFRCATMPK